MGIGINLRSRIRMWMDIAILAKNRIGLKIGVKMNIMI